MSATAGEPIVFVFNPELKAEQEAMEERRRRREGESLEEWLERNPEYKDYDGDVFHQLCDVKGMWEITGAQDEDTFLDDIVFEIVTSEDPLLPSTDSKLGHVELHWDSVGDGCVWLQARGGSVDDRRLAREVLAAQLVSHGFVEATLDLDTFQRTAGSDHDTVVI